MPLFRRRNRDAVDPEERSPQLGLKYENLQLLGLMMEDGADLDQPRHVLHYSYFPAEAIAAVARDEMAQAGWSTSVDEPLRDFPGQWSVKAERADVVLTPDFVRESTDFFEALAARHAGEYDGWKQASERPAAAAYLAALPDPRSRRGLGPERERQARSIRVQPVQPR
jgi:hypothetical protein